MVESMAEGFTSRYLSYIMMDLLGYQFIRNLVGASNGFLGYKNKGGAKFC